MASVTTLPADYRDLGHMLRDTREGMGLTLDQVTQAIRVRTAFLQALEKGELSAIPGDVYARGYLKTYADYLGYDGAQLIGRIAAGPTAPQATKYLPPDRSNDGRAMVVVILLCVVALGAAGWWQWPRDATTAAPSPVEKLPEHLAYLLDRGTPRIAVADDCDAEIPGLAQAFCREGSPFFARLFDDPSLPPSLLALPRRFPAWQQNIFVTNAPPAARAVAGSATPSAAGDATKPRYTEPLWMNPFRQ